MRSGKVRQKDKQAKGLVYRIRVRGGIPPTSYSRKNENLSFNVFTPNDLTKNYRQEKRIYKGSWRSGKDSAEGTLNKKFDVLSMGQNEDQEDDNSSGDTGDQSSGESGDDSDDNIDETSSSVSNGSGDVQFATKRQSKTKVWDSTYIKNRKFVVHPSYLEKQEEENDADSVETESSGDSSMHKNFITSFYPGKPLLKSWIREDMGPVKDESAAKKSIVDSSSGLEGTGHTRSLGSESTSMDQKQSEDHEDESRQTLGRDLIENNIDQIKNRTFDEDPSKDIQPTSKVIGEVTSISRMPHIMSRFESTAKKQMLAKMTTKPKMESYAGKISIKNNKTITTRSPVIRANQNKLIDDSSTKEVPQTMVNISTGALMNHSSSEVSVDDEFVTVRDTAPSVPFIDGDGESNIRKKESISQKEKNTGNLSRNIHPTAQHLQKKSTGISLEPSDSDLRNTLMDKADMVIQKLNKLENVTTLSPSEKVLFQSDNPSDTTDVDVESEAEKFGDLLLTSYSKGNEMKTSKTGSNNDEPELSKPENSNSTKNILKPSSRTEDLLQFNPRTNAQNVPKSGESLLDSDESKDVESKLSKSEKSLLTSHPTNNEKPSNISNLQRTNSTIDKSSSYNTGTAILSPLPNDKQSHN
ncbi:dentin sialophosphoprotein-like [Clytia hemisphaerica]|uniref:dentin sialophosphoprotein-like n=1 Tax=Clytia hemisphaerica TaxID=252671 RepID=UPI0034D5AFFA